MTSGVLPAATVRVQIAGFLDALLTVYILLIFAYILTSLIFAFGGRIPYSRWSSAVLGFLRDVCEPYLGLFRRFIPPIGPVDVSPIFAILLLSIVGQGLIVPLIHGVSARGGSPSLPAARARAGLVLAGVLLADQVAKALVTSMLRRGEEREVVAGIKLVNVRNSGVAFGQLQDGGTIVAAVIAGAVLALLAYFARNGSRPWIWLPTGLLLGGALGNVADRLREGAVVDFVKLPHWPAFNVADSAITIGVIVLLLVVERGDGARRPG